MTEYCGMCSILPPELIHYGVLCLLSTLSSMMSPMLATFHPMRSNNLQGEICIRGPSVVKRYYKRDELERPSLQMDGCGQGTVESRQNFVCY